LIKFERKTNIINNTNSA